MKLHRQPVPAALVAHAALAVFAATAALTACAPEDAHDAPEPRGLDLGGAELFGPVLAEDLAAALAKCAGETHVWVTYADDGVHFSLAAAGEAPQESTGCLAARLLQLGLVEIPDATTGDESGEGTGSTG